MYSMSFSIVHVCKVHRWPSLPELWAVDVSGEMTIGVGCLSAAVGIGRGAAGVNSEWESAVASVGWESAVVKVGMSRR